MHVHWHLPLNGRELQLSQNEDELSIQRVLDDFKREIHHNQLAYIRISHQKDPTLIPQGRIHEEALSRIHARPSLC